MEYALDNVKRNGVVGARFADAGREHKSQNPGTRLLIGAHGGKQSRGWDARPGRQRPQPANQRDNARHIFGARQAKFVAEERRSDHSPRHRFTMLVNAIFCHRLESVRKRMAEI